MRRLAVILFVLLSTLFSSHAFAASSSSSSSHKPSFHIPILVYHHIREQQKWPKTTWSWKMTVSPKIFEKQMQWIVDHGYTTIDFETFGKIASGEIQGPTKPIIITFDDNNLNAYQNGVPVLVNKGLTAVFYIITNRLKNHDTIDADRVKDLVAKGMEIESHTLDHATMTNLSLKRLDTELIESKKTLEALTGKPILSIAYPSTAQNKTVREHTKAAGYTTATIMDPRVATEKDDLMKLPRIMMTDDTNLAKTLP